MTTPFIGEIKLFAGNYAPAGWLLCQGQILPISQFTPLFNLIGTTYGGNGTTTFAIPDLRSRAIISQGQGNGLTDRSVAETGGQESVVLTSAQLPGHTHSLSAQTRPGTASVPTNAMPAAPGAKRSGYFFLAPDAAAVNAPPAAGSVEDAGSGQPHENRMPSLALSYMISPLGIFPSFT